MLLMRAARWRSPLRSASKKNSAQRVLCMCRKQNYAWHACAMLSLPDVAGMHACTRYAQG